MSEDTEFVLEAAKFSLAKLKQRKGDPQFPELAVYIFRDKPETKAANLYDLAWELSNPRSGYCSYNDAIGFFELLIKYLEKQP